MDKSEIFRLEGASFHYPGGAMALDSVSLSILQGESLAVLGSNGCGKSTLLKLLVGLLFTTRGYISAFGVGLSEESLQDEQFSRAFRQRVGFIFQRSDVQLFSPTVRDEIAFGPLQMGLSRSEVRMRVDDVVAMLRLDDLCDRPPYHLSGGEQKKVAIASVLSTNPQVLLMDEPTAALDPRTQLWFIDLLRQLQAAGKTTVVATHDLDLLPQIARRALVLGPAHTVERDGTVEEILSDHSLLHRANLAHHHLSPSASPTAPAAGVLEPAQVPGAHEHRGK